jgi:hypothetical protein
MTNDLPAPPPLYHWEGGVQNFADGKQTRHIALVLTSTGLVVGTRQIAVELYGAEGVREAANELVRSVWS